MDQIKIGNFIKQKRIEKNMTQSELAEKLNITDRAVSKWERGLCLPDAGTMPILCDILSISINDLFSGEKVDMKDNEKRLEENLLEMTQLKEQKDKQLLQLEYVIGFGSVFTYMAFIFLASFIKMDRILSVALIISAAIIIIIGVIFSLKIEQLAGYYKCSNCDHKYTPTYKSIFFAPHINRTRYMKCPKCGKKTWNKKILK